MTFKVTKQFMDELNQVVVVTKDNIKQLARNYAVYIQPQKFNDGIFPDLDKSFGKKEDFDATLEDGSSLKKIMASLDNMDKKLQWIKEQQETAYHKITYSMSVSKLTMISRDYEDKKNTFLKNTTGYFQQLQEITESIEKVINVLQKTHSTRQNKGNEFAQVERVISLVHLRSNNLDAQLLNFSSLANKQQQEYPSVAQLVNLKNAITALESEYNMEYRKKYGTFWQPLKNYFRNSDRKQEIDFLRAVSEAEGCTETIRYRAMLLVHNKILEEEQFGKNSTLCKLLYNLTRGEIAEDVDASTSLVDFLNENGYLYSKMSRSLQIYLDSNINEYNAAQAITVEPC